MTISHSEVAPDSAERRKPVKEAPKKGAASEVVEIIKTVVYALLIALVLRVFLFQPFTIPSASMEPTLLEGDYIIVSKYAYGYSRHSAPFSPPLFNGRAFGRTPTRGDIIVFKLPRDNRTDYIKRIVGLPGDRIQVRGGQLFINDAAVPRQQLSSVTVTEPYGYTHEVERFLETLPNGKRYVTYDYGSDNRYDDTAVYRVPEGHFFMMGDNRDNSSDSRVAPEEDGVGFVPAENLVGKAELILLSWNPEAALFKPWTWVLEARPSRFVHILH